MIVNREDFGFCVKVLDVCVSGAACGCSEGGVLYDLESVCVCWRYDRGPGRGGVFEDRSGDGFVGSEYGLFLFSPRCSCEGF